MNLLHKGEITKEELLSWFKITPKTFGSSKYAKLEELKDFCDYELITSLKGYLKGVNITKVYIPEYSRKMNPLKKKFLDWVKAGGVKEVAAQDPNDKTYSPTTVINYFCKQNKIPYDGAHYLRVTEDGNNSENNKIYNGTRKITNKEFSKWHYLYRIYKKYCYDNKIYCGERVNCCADSYNPTRLRLEKDKDRELQNLIYQKYFGKLDYNDVCDLVDEVSKLVEEEEITSEVRDAIIENKLMRTYTEKQKRQLAADECVELGILRRRGYQLEK